MIPRVGAVRLGAIAIVILVIAPVFLGIAHAQVIGTQCWNSGGVMTCNSQAGVLYQPPSVANQLANTFAAIALTMQQQMALRARRAEAEAAAAQVADAQRAALAESQARQEAAKRLYVERVSSVANGLADSLRIYGEAGRRFGEAIAPSLADLFIANPMATRQDIREALLPHLVTLNSQFGSFLQRVIPPMKPAVDSLALAPKEQVLFATALLPIAQDVFMRMPDATPPAFRGEIQPFLDRARAYRDSTRKAAADSLARSTPRKSRP